MTVNSLEIESGTMDSFQGPWMAINDLEMDIINIRWQKGTWGGHQGDGMTIRDLEVGFRDFG